jgi:acyl-CoA synthetase (NDP forming)
LKLFDLNALFNPEGIAVVGASNNPLKAGNVIIQNMAHGSMANRLYPVTGSEPSIAGVPAYKLLSEIPYQVELVVLIMPSSAIYAVMDDLDKRMAKQGDIKVIVCAAADYAETKTEEGVRRQARLMMAKERYGIRIVGPNCIGVINEQNGVNTTFVITGVPEERFGPQSNISFVSQSGAVAATILMEGASKPLGIRFNKFISIGNMADVNFIDLLEYLENDSSTQVIGMYLEGSQMGAGSLKPCGASQRRSRFSC